MNIENFESQDTDLHRFLQFCKRLEQTDDLAVEKQDWDNMCGIIVKCALGDSICFNFWQDGSFRCLVSVEPEPEPEPEPKRSNWWNRTLRGQTL